MNQIQTASTTKTGQQQAEKIALLLEGIIGNQKRHEFPETTLNLFKKAYKMAENGGYGLCPKCRHQNSAEELNCSPLNCSKCGAELVQEEDQENLV